MVSYRIHTKVISMKEDRKKALRLWPGLLIVILQWLLRFILPALFPDALLIGVFGGIIGGLAVLVWWAFFSRAPRLERWGAVVLIPIALYLTPNILHESVATAGQGMLFYIYAVPVVCLVFVAWAALSHKFSAKIRPVTMVITILAACAVWALLRTGGITGGGLDSDFAWRWSETPAAA